MVINSRIRELREVRQMSIENLAALTGLSTLRIRKIEARIIEPMSSEVVKIAEAYGITTTELEGD